MYFLMISEILGFFVGILTADDKYSTRYNENLPQPNQMQLSKKRKNLLWAFCYISAIYIKF